MPAIAKVLSVKANDMNSVLVASCFGLIAANGLRLGDVVAFEKRPPGAAAQ